MRICMPHWNELRAAIEERGLSGLIAGSAAKAIEAIDRQLQGADEPKDYDPLMSANFAIWTHALKVGGLYLALGDEQGNPYCPLCEADKHGGVGMAAEWIKGCSDAQLAHARELGLVNDKVQ